MKFKKIEKYIAKLLMVMFVLVTSISICFSQGVGVNENNFPPDNSAILDVSSSDKGLLIPRLSTSERDSVSNPALSLLIYNTTTNCYEFWAMGNWHELGCYPNACEGHEGTTYQYELNYEGYTYELVGVGCQCWFAHNLRYDDGCTGNAWDEDNDLGWCNWHTSDGDQNYGFLYQWSAAMNGSSVENAQGLCPTGWHVPSDDDWKLLEGFVDSLYDIGHSEWDKSGSWRGYDVSIKLKDCRTQNHASCVPLLDECKMDNHPRWTCTSESDASRVGTNDYGFSALPSAARTKYTSSGNSLGWSGSYWTSTQTTVDKAYYRIIGKGATVWRATYPKESAFAIRCVKD